MSGEMPFREELERPAPDAVTVDGVELRRGSRVRLRPRAGRDVFDLALAGRDAVIESIDQDYEDRLHVAVTLEDDPGRDLGEDRQPGHRFFFSLDEIEPLGGPTTVASGKRVLVAGVGNVFLGDDGFGVEAAARIGRRRLPPGVDVVDFGIRGMDLAYALQDGYDAAIFVDAVPRGGAPGTLYVIEPDLPEAGGPLDAHGMDPVKVLAFAQKLGGVPDRVLVIGCEPGSRRTVEDEELLVELSEPVRGALDEAVRLVESLVEEVMASEESQRKVGPS